MFMRILQLSSWLEVFYFLMQQSDVTYIYVSLSCSYLRADRFKNKHHSFHRPDASPSLESH